MTVTIDFFNSTSPKDLLIDFCKDAEQDWKPGSKNMAVEDWEKNPASLLYKIYAEKVYDDENRGRYYAHIEDNRIIAAMGVNSWDKDPNVCLGGTRLYVVRDRRQPHASEKEKEWLKRFGELWEASRAYQVEAGYKVVMYTYNEYNRAFLEKYMEAAPQIKLYEHPIVVNYTRQWAGYLMLDPAYEEEFLNVLAANRF